MSLDFYLKKTQPTVIFDANITHNLNKMAMEAGIYDCLWHPNDNGITKAHQMVLPLTEGLLKLTKSPSKFREFNAPNGWGTYEHFVPFVKSVLEACIEHPDADVSVWI